MSTSVAAGSTHTATVYVKADAAATGSLRLRTLGGTAESGTVNFTASSSGWLKVSVALTTRSAHTGLVLEVVAGQSGRTYRLDSVSLVRTGEPAASPAPAPSTAPSQSPAPAPSTAPPPSAPAPSPTPSPSAPTPAPASSPLIRIGGLRLG